MNNNIKYGIIGAGVMGQEHIHNINIIDNAEVVAICDTNEGSTNQARSLIKDTAKIYNNLEDLINNNIADAYIIATPNFTHIDILEKILKTNKRKFAIISGGETTVTVSGSGKGGRNSEYALCAAQWHKTLSYSDSFFGDGQQYDKEFNDMYGYAPPYQAAESSAALLVYKEAFEKKLLPNSLTDEKYFNIKRMQSIKLS